MKELEDMISIIGSDAMSNQMQIYNQDLENEQVFSDLDEEAAEEKRRLIQE